jgi:hypothetical protein
MSATALGTGAVVVVAVGLGVSIARTGDGGVQPAADSARSTPSAAASPTPTPSVGRTSAPPVRGDRHHSGVPGAGQQGSGQQGSGPHGGAKKPSPTELPFTGPLPLPATTALGLLLTAAGSWTLVRVPGAPGQAPVVVVDGAIARLRAPRRPTR